MTLILGSFWRLRQNYARSKTDNNRTHWKESAVSCDDRRVDAS
jgi:hypothetical protein